MRNRPIVIACRVTAHERSVLEAAARLEQESLAEMVRKGALRGAIDRLRAVQPQENTKRELVGDVEDRAVA